jgi:hypothetical protein
MKTGKREQNAAFTGSLLHTEFCAAVRLLNSGIISIFPH